MTEDIKSAAQVVLDAFNEGWWYPEDITEFNIATVLRVAAYQIEDLYCESDLDDSEGVVFALRHLCLIADEIETL